MHAGIHTNVQLWSSFNPQCQFGYHHSRNNITTLLSICTKEQCEVVSFGWSCTFLGLKRAYTGTLSIEWNKSKQYWGAPALVENCYLNEILRKVNEGCCIVIWQCSLRTLIHLFDTLWHMNLEVSEHPLWNSDQTPPDYHTFGPFKDALVQCFTSDKKRKKQCLHCLSDNQKHIFWGHRETYGLVK